MAFLITPVELIKCSMFFIDMCLSNHLDLQVQDIHLYKTPNFYSTQFKGPFAFLSHTLKSHGIKGLYRGNIGTMLRESVGGAAMFGTKEVIDRLWIKSTVGAKSRKELNPLQLIISDTLSGMARVAAFYPADVIKTRQACHLDCLFKFVFSKRRALRETSMGRAALFKLGARS